MIDFSRVCRVFCVITTNILLINISHAENFTFSNSKFKIEFSSEWIQLEPPVPSPNLEVNGTLLDQNSYEQLREAIGDLSQSDLAIINLTDVELGALYTLIIGSEAWHNENDLTQAEIEELMFKSHGKDFDEIITDALSKHLTERTASMKRSNPELTVTSSDTLFRGVAQLGNAPCRLYESRAIISLNRTLPFTYLRIIYCGYIKFNNDGLNIQMSSLSSNEQVYEMDVASLLGDKFSILNTLFVFK